MLKVVIIVVTMLEVSQQGHTANCPNPRESSMKLTITSRRNQTGHWTAQATLEHGTDVTIEDEVNTNPWTLNLEQSTAHCDKLESVVLTATVTGLKDQATVFGGLRLDGGLHSVEFSSLASLRTLLKSLLRVGSLLGTLEVVCSWADSDDVGCVQSGNIRVASLLVHIAPPHKAGPGYEFHKGVGYYKLHTTMKTWAEARDTCIQEGAHLAIINSEEESKVLLEIFERLVPDKKIVWAFIGFHDLYAENQFLTVLGEPLNSTGFLRWAGSGLPDNVGASATNAGEDCGSFYRLNGGVNDHGCGAKLYFFCEQELW